jgi:alanine racemase
MVSDYSRVEISSSALRHNWQVFRQLLPQSVKMAAVIKANAYGHDQRVVMSVLEDLADYWQVDSLRELKIVRETSQKPTLVLGYVPQADLAETVALQATLAVYDSQRLPLLNELARASGKPIAVHIKIDALFGRQGLLIEQLTTFLEEIKRFPYIEVTGFYAHYAEADDPSAQEHTQQQLDLFEKAETIFAQAGYQNLTSHIAATAGILAQETKHPTHSLVRLGIGLYGLWPSTQLQNEWEEKMPLQPVLRWVSLVAQVKTVPTGFPIGYGATLITRHATKIAIIPIGYADGFDRGLSNCGKVLIHGQMCPVLGRVSMNMIVVDVTDLADVQVEEEVVILGKQGSAEITATQIAQKIDTINYEIVTRISPLLSREVIVY